MPVMKIKLKGLSLFDACLAIEAIACVEVKSATVIDDEYAMINYEAIETDDAPDWISEDWDDESYNSYDDDFYHP